MMSVYHVLVLANLLALSLAQSETTTPATSTSSTEIPSTTPSIPAPAPTPTNVPTWMVKSANSTCLLLRGNFTFAVTYTPPTGNIAVSQKVDIPPTAKVSGTCGPFINTLVLTWDKNTLTFMFIKKPIYDAGVDTGMGSYSLTTMFGMLTVENPNDNGNSSSPSSPSSGPGQSFFIAVKQPEYMSTQLHNSYTCDSFQSIAADKTGSVYLEMKGIQVEAFHDGADENFSESQPCSKDKMSYVMTILGYTALAALVAAVVGYLAWKKFGRGGYTQV